MLPMLSFALSIAACYTHVGKFIVCYTHVGKFIACLTHVGKFIACYTHLGKFIVCYTHVGKFIVNVFWGLFFVEVMHHRLGKGFLRH